MADVASKLSTAQIVSGVRGVVMKLLEWMGRAMRGNTRARLLSFAGYTWEDSKGCRACTHVLDGSPVLMFVHETDGSLQFLCGAEGHTEADAIWLHASHVFAKNPDLTDLPVVNFGFEAERSARTEPWTVRAFVDEG